MTPWCWSPCQAPGGSPPHRQIESRYRGAKPQYHSLFSAFSWKNKKYIKLLLHFSLVFFFFFLIIGLGFTSYIYTFTPHINMFLLGWQWGPVDMPAHSFLLQILHLELDTFPLSGIIPKDHLVLPLPMTTWIFQSKPYLLGSIWF